MEDVGALLQQDGFTPEHPADGIWTIWFEAPDIGKFQVCFALASNGRNLIASVPLIDPSEIPPDTKLPMVRLLQQRAVRLTDDKAGRLVIYDVVPRDRINAYAIKGSIEKAASDAAWTYGQMRPYLASFREPTCDGQPSS
ncbi:MAG TPA: hypothetical protein VG387_17765 [Rhizomicrobium sp.]|jgi:hypothetical protein|nr:hypothetical protein [Rhizomicrobium sp.]